MVSLTWEVYPQKSFTSFTCEADFKVAYTNLPLSVMFNAETYTLHVTVDDLYSNSGSALGCGKTHFKCCVKPIYHQVPKTDEDGKPIPGQYETALVTNVEYYCVVNGGSFDNAKVYQDDFGRVWLEGDIQPSGPGGSASITVPRLVFHDFVCICSVSTYSYYISEYSPNDWSHKWVWDDVKVTFKLKPNFKASSEMKTVQHKTLEQTIVLGDNDPHRVGTSYTWTLVPMTSINQGEVDAGYINALIESAEPVPLSTLPYQVKVVGSYRCVGPYNYRERMDDYGETKTVWTYPSDDPTSDEFDDWEWMTTLILFTDGFTDILSFIDAILSGTFAKDINHEWFVQNQNRFIGPHVTVICVDVASYQQYKMGQSDTFTALIIHVIVQHNKFKVKPIDVSEANVGTTQMDIKTGSYLTTENCYSSNGYAWVEISRKTEEDRTSTSRVFQMLQYVKGAYVKSQFHLILDAVYGTPVTTDTPEFLVDVQMPNCIAMYLHWHETFPSPGDDSTTINNDDIPPPDIPSLDDYSIYTCEVIGKDSYSWRCDENATFDVVVKRIDNVAIQPSNYTLEVECDDKDVKFTIDQSKSQVIFDLPHEDKFITFNVKAHVNGASEPAYGYGSFHVSEWGDRVLQCEVSTDKLYYEYGSTDPAKISVKVYDLNGNPVGGLQITDNWSNTYSDDGDGNYSTEMDVSKLPVGQYTIYVKIDPNGKCYKSNLSDQIVVETFTYNPADYPNQDFKLTYPLIENLKVYVNDTEITDYTTALNMYGELILHINQTLNEGDKVRVEYQAYMSSTFFYIGNPEPISCTQTDERSIAKFGRTPALKIYIPFLSSREEACEIAKQYLKYYAWPPKIIITDNKW